MGKRTVVVMASLALIGGVGAGIWLQPHLLGASTPAAQQPAAASILHPLPVMTSPVQPLDALRAGLQAKAASMRAAACDVPRKPKKRASIPAPPQRPFPEHLYGVNE